MNIKVDGIGNALRNLDKAKPKVWRREVTKELKGDQKALRNAMKAEMPKATGKMARSVRTKAWVKKKADGELLINVATGPRTYGNGRVWYAHFAENNKTTGGFMAKSWKAYGNKITNDGIKTILKYIEKANG